MKKSKKYCLCLIMLPCGSLVFPLDTGQQCLSSMTPFAHALWALSGAGIPGLVRNERF